MTSKIHFQDSRRFEVERFGPPGALEAVDSADRMMTGTEIWEVLNAWLSIRSGGKPVKFAGPAGVHIVLGTVPEVRKVVF